MENTIRDLKIMLLCSLVCILLSDFVLDYGIKNFMPYVVKLGIVLLAAGIGSSFAFVLWLIILILIPSICIKS